MFINFNKIPVIICLVMICAVNANPDDDIDNIENVIDYSGQDISSPDSSSNEILSSEEKDILNKAFKIKSDDMDAVTELPQNLTFDHTKSNASNTTDNSDYNDFYEPSASSVLTNTNNNDKKPEVLNTTEIIDERETENDEKDEDDYESDDDISQDVSDVMNTTERTKVMSTRRHIYVKATRVTRPRVTRVHDFDSNSTTTIRNLNEFKRNIYHSLVDTLHQNQTSDTECRKSRRILNSDEDPASTTLLNYPFVVSIQKRGSHYASGALLNNKWVLSVAGEFYNVRESLKLFRLRCGSVDNKRGGVLVPLKRVVIHPSYVTGQPNFDLAMLMVGRPVTYSDVIKPISMSKLTSKVIGGKFLTTYWPRIILKGEPLPSTARERTRQNSLRVSTQKMIPPQKCNKLMLNAKTNIDDSTLCLKPFVSHHSICVPDAGAPVVGEDGIWGITSGWTSKDCLQNPSPYVFTRIASTPVRSWIDKQLQGT